MNNKVLDISYNELLELSKKENEDVLREYTKELVTIARNRAKSLKNHPVAQFSPALRNYDEKLSNKNIFKNIKKMSHNDLLKTYASAKTFTNAKTSTVSGFNKVKKELYERLGFDPKEHKSNKGRKRTKSPEYYEKKKISGERRFWKLYDKLLDNFGGSINDLGSERIQSILYDLMFDKTKYKTNDEILDTMNETIKRLYEESQDYYSGDEEFRLL